MSSSRTRFYLAAAFYLLAICVRLYGSIEIAPQTDEITWTKRSAHLLSLFKQHRYSELTSHLGHPGATSALVMSLGQKTVQKYNLTFKLEPGHRWYLDPLSGSRLANIVFSSLVVPCVYLITLYSLGPPEAVLASILTATDISLVGYSRIAHVDSFLAVFVLLSLFFYTQAVLQKKLPLKLLAGVCWGLAVATKVTAIALIPTFLLFKALRYLLIKTKSPENEWSLINWGDVWAVIVGHIALVAVFTRLWDHNSAYRIRLGIASPLADKLYSLGTLLNGSYPLVTAITLAAVVLLACFLLRLSHTKPKLFHLALALFTIAFLAAAVAAFPAVIENLTRFWTRTMGFSHMTHRSFGRLLPPPRYSYLALAVTKISVVTLLSFICGVFFFFSSLRKMASDDREQKKFSLLLALIISIVIWPLLLSFSKKQAFRYMLPLVPAICIFASYGLNNIWADLRLKFGPTTDLSKSRSGLLAQTSLPLFVAFLQACLLFKSYPDYLLYSSPLTGGLKGVVSRGAPLFLSGINESLAVLQQRASSRQTKLNVALLADRQTTRSSYNRLYPSTSEHYLNLFFTKEFQNADYVLVVHSLVSSIEQRAKEKLKELKEIFAYSRDGVALTSVYEVPQLDYHQVKYREVNSSFHQTGNYKKLEDLLEKPQNLPFNSNKALAAFPGTDGRGALLFNERIKLLPGSYHFNYFLGLPKNSNISSVDTETAVLTIQFNGNKRIVKADELQQGRVTPVDIQYAIENEGKYSIVIFWSGKVPVFLAGYSVLQQ